MEYNDLIERQTEIEDFFLEKYGARPTKNTVAGDRYGLVDEWHRNNEKMREIQDKELSKYE